MREIALQEIIERITQQKKGNGRDTDLQSLNIQEKSIQQELSDVCAECGGTGWAEVQDEEGYPSYRRCKCYELEKAQRMWKSAGINTEQVKQTFRSYKPYNKVTETAKATAIQYYKDFKNIKDSKRNSIAFVGQVGSGKTHLSIALAVNFLNKGIPVVYMPYRDVITKIKQNMLDEEYYRKEISKYQVAQVLLIDDLFKGKINDSDINIMFEIINYRYLNQLPIIVSSEYTAERLLNFDEGVGSRIIEMCKDYTVEVRGKENNYRLNNGEV